MKNKLLITSLIVVTPLLVIAKVPDNSFYLGAGAGVGQISYYGNSSEGLIRFDGGYNLNEYISFEAGLNQFFGASTTSSYGSTNVSGTGLDISVLPNIPLGLNAPINIFFRLGVGYDMMSSTISNQSSLVDIEGIGFRYDISAHLALSGQYIARGLLMQPGNANYSQNNFLANLSFYF